MLPDTSVKEESGQTQLAYPLGVDDLVVAVFVEVGKTGDLLVGGRELKPSRGLIRLHRRSLDQEQAAAAAADLLLRVPQQTLTVAFAARAGIDHDPVEIVRALSQRSLADADVAAHCAIVFDDVDVVIAAVVLLDGLVDQLQRCLDLLIGEVAGVGDDRYQQRAVVRFNRPNVHGVSFAAAVRATVSMAMATSAAP